MSGRLMPPGRKYATWTVCTLIWTTGVAWLLLHYFGQRQGAFGMEANPAEIWMLRMHGAAAFAALWLLGLLWGVHVVRGWEQHKRRVSGAILFGAALLLVVSGYLLYYLGDETARAAVSLLHWLLGVIAALLFLAHRLWRRA
ncbi:MAG: hypothetical protein QM759_01595 [Terricaulis sp.]